MTKKKLLLASLIVVLIAGFVIALAYRFDGPYLLASGDCKSLVQKLRPTDYYHLASINCTFESRTIGNSSLKAQFYTFQATSAADNCQGPDAAANLGCDSSSGVLTSDGKIHSGIGDFRGEIPVDYDYCFSTRSLLSAGDYAPGIPGSSQDLYFYQGHLFERYRYTNVLVQRKYGTCVLNGTLLYSSDPPEPRIITNVTVQYKQVPTNCASILIGGSANDWMGCRAFVAAAYQRDDVCSYVYNNLPIYGNNEAITDFRTMSQAAALPGDSKAVNQECETAYVERMAALQRCPEVVAVDLRQQCITDLSRPSDVIDIDVLRIFTPL